MRRIVAVMSMFTITAAGLVAISAPAQAAEPKATPFAMGAFGIGTAVTGGQFPAESGKTAYRIIGCTNRAPVQRVNHIAEAEVPGLGTVSGVTTRVWTSAKDGVVASHATHSVAKVVIGEGSDQGTLVIRGIHSETRAWHDDKGFDASRATEIASITHHPVEGEPRGVEIPTPGRTVEVPGLARLKLGSHSKHKSDTGARAYATTLKIEVIPSDTVARVAHTSSRIGGGVKSALFRGNSNATRVSAFDDHLTSGPNMFLPMPCPGTDGEVQANDMSEMNLGDQIVASGLNTQQQSDQTTQKAWGYEKASIAEVSLGGGRLVLEGIVAKATVKREGKVVKRHVRGTTLGSLTVDGEPRAIPDPGRTLEIPGLARIETQVVDKSRNGIAVTSVRVTLLDAADQATAIVNLAQAKLQILRSGR